MSHKDDYFDGDTYDLLLYKIAQRDKVIELCKRVLEDARGNINPERGFCEEVESEIEKALAAIEELKGKS